MDDPLPATPACGDTVSEETDDSTKLERDLKDDCVVLAQPTVEEIVSPLDLSANDPPLGPSAHDAQNLDVQGALDSSAQNAQNPTSQDAPNVQF